MLASHGATVVVIMADARPDADMHGDGAEGSGRPGRTI